MPGHLGVGIHTCLFVPRALHVKSARGQRDIVLCDDAQLLIQWSSLQGSPFHLLSVQVHELPSLTEPIRLILQHMACPLKDRSSWLHRPNEQPPEGWESLVLLHPDIHLPNTR